MKAAKPLLTVLAVMGLSALAGGSVLTAIAEDTVATAVDADYEAGLLDWRRRRNERLASDSGWLTLVGLEWLGSGENRVGLGEDSDIRIPGGPVDWGVITVDGDILRYDPAATEGLLVDGRPAEPVRLVADSQGRPTVVSHGDLSFYVIYRESYALRIKNRRAPELLAFQGVDAFPIDSSWRFNARFIPAAKGETVEIGNVLGQVDQAPVLGTVEFEREGHTYRLVGLGGDDSDSLWFLFADRTNGRETYGAGRFLYSDGLPEDGRVVVDFNKAYNPPCAFTDYATCPLPPQQNRLDLKVTAGEKGSHHH